MKNKKIHAVMLLLILGFALLVTACGKSGGSESSGAGTAKSNTLEQYAKENKEVQESIDKATSDSDVEVSIKGNEVTYSYELSKMDDFTEDIANDSSVIDAMQSTLDSAGPTFGGIAKTLEDATGISGIKVTVRYTYKDEEIAAKTFDSSDASKGTSSGEGSGEEGSEDTDAEAADAADSEDGTASGSSDSDSE